MRSINGESKAAVISKFKEGTRQSPGLWYFNTVTDVAVLRLFKTIKFALKLSE